MSVRPQPLGREDLAGAVDEEQGLVVGGVGCAPPVKEAGDVAVREGLLDVVRPRQAFTVATGHVPLKKDVSETIQIANDTLQTHVVCKAIEGRPLGLPHALAGLEWRSRARAVAVAGYQTESVLGTCSLDAGQALSVLLPSTAVAACDLGGQLGPVDSGVKHLEEVGSLLASGGH